MALAYRLTGTVEDAEEAVQETFRRAIERPPPRIDDPWKPWLTRVATNICLDALRRRRTRGYAGPWIPSPLLETDRDFVGSDPAQTSPKDPASQYELRETATLAFLIALETLTPHQRAALVLREAFELSIRDIGDVLRLSEGSVRMLIQRARDKLRMHRPDRRHSMRELESNTRAALHRLVEAMRRGNVAELAALLAEDVTLRTDSDGQVTALPGPMTGAERVATLLVRVAARRLPGSRVDWIVVNALPALWISFARTERRQAPHVLLACDLSDSGTIRDLFAIVNSVKLSRLASVGISESAAR